MFQSDNQLFWSNLEKIKDVLLLNDVEFALSMGMKPEEYQSSQKRNATLPMDCMFALAEKLNFHLEDLFLNSDFQVKYDPYGQQPLLERYSHAQHSQTRAIINILNYLEMTKGSRAKINLIRMFQLSEDYIKNENNSANVLLITDILKYLRKNHNFKNDDFLGIGRRMPFLENNKILKDKLSVHKNAHDILECMVYECTKLFDTNCTYTIATSATDYAVLDVSPNKNVVDDLRLNNIDFGNEELCLTKMGNFSASLYFKYNTNAAIKKIRSIHSGHNSNQYLIDLSPFNHIDKIKNSPKATKLHLVH